MTSTFQPRAQSRPEPARIDRPVTYDAITVTPESPHIGAEIGGVDLTAPLSERQVEQLRAAFAQYQVVFFRDQHISFEDQIRLASYFGSLGAHAGKATISSRPRTRWCASFTTMRTRS
jgi:taurine dioxygenase